MGTPTGTVVRIDGGKVRQLREEKGLTQLYVATVVGVTTDTISRWENRHYNTVKYDNAVKLAEALELTLEEILLQAPKPAPEPEPASAPPPVIAETSVLEAPELPHPAEPQAEAAIFTVLSDNQPPQVHQQEEVEAPSQATDGNLSRESSVSPVKPSSNSWIIFPIITILVLAPFFWWKFSSQSPPMPPLNIQVTRSLPAHAAPGQSFPVVIRIDGLGDEELPFILKEQLPDGIKPRNGIPPFTAMNEKDGSIKWISKASSSTSPFCYMASVSQDTNEEKSPVFQGSITVKDGGSSTFTVSGQNTIEIALFHWADTNRDLRIDDDEILAVHDSLSTIPATELKMAEIEALWSAGEYAWNPKKRQFTPKH